MTRTLAYMPVDEVQPAERNPKGHRADDLRASIDRFGYTEPLLLDERTGRLIAGHGRLDAVRARQADGQPAPDGVQVAEDGRWLVPVVRGWASADDAEAEAALVASNQLTIAGGWDEAALTALLDGLGQGPGLQGVGFDQAALDDLLAAVQEAPLSYEEGSQAAHPENTYEDWADNYRNKQVRSMVFDYPLSDYAVITEHATRARAAFGVASNAELFQAMLTEWASSNPA